MPIFQASPLSGEAPGGPRRGAPQSNKAGRANPNMAGKRPPFKRTFENRRMAQNRKAWASQRGRDFATAQPANCPDALLFSG